MKFTTALVTMGPALVQGFTFPVGLPDGIYHSSLADDAGPPTFLGNVTVPNPNNMHRRRSATNKREVQVDLPMYYPRCTRGWLRHSDEAIAFNNLVDQCDNHGAFAKPGEVFWSLYNVRPLLFGLLSRPN